MSEKKTYLPVETLDNPRRAIFESGYLSRGKPVLIRDALRNWKAVSTWTPEYLRSQAGARTVSVTYNPGAIYERANPRPMRLRDYVDLITSDDDPDRRKHYVAGVEVNKVLPELIPDFETPEIIAGRTATLNVFLGRDSATGCHFHPYEEAILCQIMGRKRVLLFPPTEFAQLHPKGPLAGHFNWSRISDVDRPDLNQFPRFRDAKGLECTVEAGDMLFIPVHWWHAVYGPGWSVSGTFFWRASLTRWHYPHPALRCAVAWPFLRSRGLRALIPKSVRSA